MVEKKYESEDALLGQRFEAGNRGSPFRILEKSAADIGLTDEERPELLERYRPHLLERDDEHR